MLGLSDSLEMINSVEMGVAIYKRASSGATQVWRVERDGNKFRTIHGQIDGAQIISEWTICTGKNIGKKNETTPQQQAKLEVEALYKKKLAQGKYTHNVDAIDIAEYISPMLAQPFTPKKMEYPCSVQPKLDGVRCIATAKGFFTRKGKPIPVVRHIAESLAPLFEEYPGLILDGELYNHDYKNRFEELISAIRQQKPKEEDFDLAKEVVHFHVYDVPNAEYRYPARRELIHAMLGSPDDGRVDGIYSNSTDYDHVFILDNWSGVQDEEQINRIFGLCVDYGYEGAIIRLHNNYYENKRTYQLQKYKDFIDEEFEVADIREGKGNWAGHAKIAVLWLPGADKSRGIIEDGDNPTVFSAGVKGSKEYAKKLLANKHEVIGKLATVTYFRKTAYGIPYLPIFKVLRDYE